MTKTKRFNPYETRVLEKNYFHRANQRTVVDTKPDEILDQYLFRGIKDAIKHTRVRS